MNAMGHLTLFCSRIFFAAVAIICRSDIGLFILVFLCLHAPCRHNIPTCYFLQVSLSQLEPP